MIETQSSAFLACLLLSYGGSLKLKVTRQELILAALAASNGDTHTPVQMQKLLFLIDKKIPQHVGGPHFQFEPYDYGPFDARVYHSLDNLAIQGLVEILTQPNLRWKKYKASESGLELGRTLLSSLDPPVQAYIKSLSSFVRRLSFAELVSSIYREYPEMREKSVFRG
jgi:uncharacterized protein